MTTGGSGGSARIRGRPGSSTSPATRPCWGRSTAAPAPQSPPGSPSRTEPFRAGIKVVALDPSAPYAAAVRQALPTAVIAVDHFHLVPLGERAITGVRQRVAADGLRRTSAGPLGGPGVGVAAGAAARPRTAVGEDVAEDVERLHRPRPDLERTWAASMAAGGAGRALLACARRGGQRHEVRRPGVARLLRLESRPPSIVEVTTLAETIDPRWWAMLVFLQTGITNARTEGTNRLIKQVKRAACGFRNRENYRRRVRLHCTRRTRRLSARKPTVPGPHRCACPHRFAAGQPAQ